MKATAFFFSAAVLLAAPAALADNGPAVQTEQNQPARKVGKDGKPGKDGQPGKSAQNPDRAPAAADETRPAKLAAVLHPAKHHKSVKGTVEFSQTGDMLNVTGRIDGLEPIKQYGLSLLPAFEDPALPPLPPFDAGTPDAGTPEAGTPDGVSRSVGGDADPSAVPVPPAEGVDLPDPGASFAGRGEGGITILTTDSTGGVNINATIPNANLAKGPDGVLGRSVVLQAAKVGETNGMSGEIASGKIVAARDGRNVPHEKAAPGTSAGASGKAVTSPQPLPPSDQKRP